MTDQDAPQPPAGEFVLFAAADGKVHIECRFAANPLWLSQAITQHVRAVYAEGELDQHVTCKDYLHVQTEGKRQVPTKE